MKKQQQWVKDIMFNIIKLMQENKYNGDFMTVGYRYTINAAIDNYPQVYWDKTNRRNTGLFHKYLKFDEKIYQNVLMSKNAYECMEKFSKENSSKDTKSKNLAKKELVKKLHGEHLTPQSYTLKKLNELISKHNLTDEDLKEKIQYAFTDSKLCIITKDESKHLDGAGKRFSEKDINNFLVDYEKIYGNSMPEHLKSDFLKLEGKLMKSYGFGSIRLYILLQNDVIFMNDKGEEKNFKECIEYLKDDNYSIEPVNVRDS